jgi:hypothetical protein
MNHLAQTLHFHDSVSTPEVFTWCGRSASTIAIGDWLVFEAALNQCAACSNARSDALHGAQPIRDEQTEAGHA